MHFSYTFRSVQKKIISIVICVRVLYEPEMIDFLDGKFNFRKNDNLIACWTLEYDTSFDNFDMDTWSKRKEPVKEIFKNVTQQKVTFSKG